MSVSKALLAVPVLILLIMFGLTACGNNDDSSAKDVGAAEEIRGTLLDTSSKVADKASETATMAVEKATEAAEKAAEVSGEAIDDAKEVVGEAVDNAADAVEARISVPSMTEEKTDEQ